jgi:predicted RNase H-like HicB family nuclease
MVGIFNQGGIKKMKIKVVLESAEEGDYTVYVPSLPGCISEGDTFDEAMKNIKEAFELYLEPDEDELFMQAKSHTRRQDNSCSLPGCISL